MSACPGVTAWSVARMRAKHQIVDGATIFRDSFALRILDCDGREMLCEPEDPYAARYRAFMCVRSRVADDGACAAARRGVGQIVVLGAGLDTTGLRHAGRNGVLRVFEVDKPIMQDWKRSHLRRIGLDVPASIVFVPVDFEHQSLPDELAKAGFNANVAAFFIWLGVVPYLTREAITRTLDFVASIPDSEIVFDYTEPAENRAPAARAAFERRSRHVALAGEPWLSHFDPPDMHAMLRKAGFATIADLERHDFHARYPTPLLAVGPDASRSGAHVLHASRT